MPDLVRVGQTQERVAFGLFALAEPTAGWTRIDARFASAGSSLDGSMSVCRPVVTGPDGDTVVPRLTIATFDHAVVAPWRELKELMATERGAWFSSTARVTPDGSYEFTHNYDRENDLAWARPHISDECWRDDLVCFPRPWGGVPEWHPVRRTHTEREYRRLVRPYRLPWRR